jgi:glyoxylase-like metal-dependent hydrolase (beta-lactamase superfamily II)
MVRRGMSRLIDVMHLGRERVIGAWELDGLVVDPGPASSVETLLGALGGEQPRALVLTHIHLDHAGASGVLVRRFPELTVYVHERGAPHLADPSKLIASAARLYGEQNMARLWGEVVPVPRSNLRPLRGGETVEGLRVAYTPGHASHHVCYLHEATGDAYVGDMAGVRIPPSRFTLPPTPPPDIDLEAWRSSLDLIAAWQPRVLRLTHFGEVSAVEAQLETVRERLARWGERARELDEAGFVAAVEAEIRAGADPETAASFIQAAPPDQLWQGLARYWRKRREQEAA